MSNGPFSLPRTDNGTQINPTLQAVVSNPDIGVSITIPANTAMMPDGSQFTGILSISEVPRGLTPGVLPSRLDPALIVTIQPLGVTFATPVPITFPNTDGLPAGSLLDIWSLNPDTGQFNIVGTGRVSNDGQRVETISGGVRQSDWHFPIPREPESPNDPPPPDEDNPCNCPHKKSGSSVSLSDGRMQTEFMLPAYRSLATSRALTFIYQSHQALPTPDITFNLRVAAGTARPNSFSYELSVAGLRQGVEAFVSTQGVTTGVTMRSGLTFDGSEFATGMYPYQLQINGNYTASSIGRVDSGDVMITNEQNSPFGAGWMLRGLYRLAINVDGTVLLVSPTGRSINYRPSAIENVFTAPDNDYAQFVRNPDGSYTHTEKNGIKMHFDVNGLLTIREDRNNNTTSYQYDANAKLITITDPVGLFTNLDYVNDKLNTVTDPAGRVTRFRTRCIRQLNPDDLSG